MNTAELRIISAAHKLDRNMMGFYVAAGEGESFRIFGWAANMKLAKKLRADVKKNREMYG